MHINDIRGFAHKVNLDKQFGGRRAKVVVILPKDGQRHYIAKSGGTTLDREAAFVYDYDRHGVAEQCEQVVQVMGVNPEVEEYTMG